MKELDRLNKRLKMLILNTCNTIGCKDCPYKWEYDNGLKTSCSSNTLQDQIFRLKEQQTKTPNEGG